MMDDDALLDEFVIESCEHLESIEEELLELETQGEDADPDLVNKLFRSVHSIKGGAGFLGLTAINQLAHTMENLLDRMRESELVPDKDNVGELLAGADVLKGMLADPATGTDEAAVAPLIARIKAQTGVAGEPPPAPSAFHDASGSHVAVPQPSSSEWVTRPPEYQHLYLLRIADLKEYETRTGRSPIGLIEELTLVGTVLSQRFVADALDLRAGIPDRSLTLEILYASLFERAMLAESIGLLEAAITPIQPDDEDEARRAMRETPVMSPTSRTATPAAKPPAPSAPAAETPAPAAPAAAVSPPPGPVAAATGDDDEVVPPIHQAPTLESPKPGKGAASGGGDAGKRQVVRVNLDLLDRLMSLAGELVLVRNRQLQLLDGADDGVSRKLVNQLNAVTNDLQDAVMRTRMQQVGAAFAKLPRIVRDLSQKLGKEIELTTTGNETELDKTILEALADPLTHLIRNACDHGVETPQVRQAAGKPALGHIEVAAQHEAGQIVIEIRDDGGGINPDKVGAKAVERGLKQAHEIEGMSERELVSLIMMPGFSTAEALSDVSGRGVGMDVVKSSIEALGGTIGVESVRGEGSLFRMRLPLTLAIISSLVVRSEERRYAIPQVNLEEIVTIYREDLPGRLEYANHQAVYRLRNHMLPLVYLDELLAADEPFDEIRQAEQTARRREAELPDKLTFVVVKMGDDRFGLVVDEVVGSEDIVVKPMHPALKNLRCYSGSTILGDGSVALILDITGISDHARVDLAHHVYAGDEEDHHRRGGTDDHTAELFFTLGGDEHFALPLPLIRRIVTVERGDFEEVGGKTYVQIDGTSIRVCSIDAHLPVRCDRERDGYHLILPRHINRPLGFLAADLVDVGTDYPMPDPDAYVDRSVLGAAVVDGHTTLFLDMFHIAEQEEPSWFQEEEKEVAPEEVPRDFGRGRSVLLAEDVGFFRRMLGGYLQAAGFAVTTAKNGREAYEMLQRADFDLLVSDIEMPEMDGNQLIKAQRQGGRNAGIPAMALSALSKDIDRARSRKAGFDAYEVKVDRERMYQSLYELLRRSQRGRHEEAAG